MEKNSATDSFPLKICYNFSEVSQWIRSQNTANSSSNIREQKWQIRDKEESIPKIRFKMEDMGSEIIKMPSDKRSSLDGIVVNKHLLTPITFVPYNPLHLFKIICKNCDNNLSKLQYDILIMVAVHLTTGPKLDKIYSNLDPDMLYYVRPILQRHSVVDGPSNFSHDTVSLEKVAYAFPRITAILLHKGCGKIYGKLRGLPRALASFSGGALLPNCYPNLKEVWSRWAKRFYKMLTSCVAQDSKKPEYRIHTIDIFTEKEKIAILAEFGIDKDLEIREKEPKVTTPISKPKDTFFETDFEFEKICDLNAVNRNKLANSKIRNLLPFNISSKDDIEREISLYSRMCGISIVKELELQIVFVTLDTSGIMDHLQARQPVRSILDKDIVVLLRLYLICGPRLDNVRRCRSIGTEIINSVLGKYEINDGPAKYPGDLTLDMISYAYPHATAILKNCGNGKVAGDFGLLPKCLTTLSGISLIPVGWENLRNAWCKWAASFLNTVTGNASYEKIFLRFYINSTLSDSQRRTIMKDLNIKEI